MSDGKTEREMDRQFGAASAVMQSSDSGRELGVELLLLCNERSQFR